MDPKFNAREIVKQSWLLEDHLITPQKNCCDCIKKHFLALEGLAEEAAALECRKYACPPLLKTYASKVRAMHHAFEHAPKARRSVVMLVVARRLRQLRKRLMKDDGVAIPLHKLPDKERAEVAAIHREALVLDGLADGAAALERAQVAAFQRAYSGSCRHGQREFADQATPVPSSTSTIQALMWSRRSMASMASGGMVANSALYSGGLRGKNSWRPNGTRVGLSLSLQSYL